MIPSKLGLEVAKMAKRTQQDTQFKPEGVEALSRKVIGVKVSLEVEDALTKLPATERGKWLRRVITEAVKTELLKDEVA